MRRIALLAVIAAIATGALAPAAQANHLYLSAGEAARLVGKSLHRKWNGIQRGSLDASCPAWPGRRDYRFCTYTYYTQGGTCWKGSMAIRLVSDNWYRYRIWSDRKCHGYR
ncbi:MAG TPA: hypothetical protein VIS51_10065 [Solirubrobacterales bacterium]